MAYKSALSDDKQTELSYKDTNLPNDTKEEIIVVDSGLRNIIIPQTLKTVGVAGDHKAEALFFQIPRYFDGNDLSTHSALIRFINAGNEYGEYQITSKAIDDDFIILGWQVSNYVTRYSGTVNFTVLFETVDSNGIEYQWQTVPAQLIVLPGLKIEATITDKDDSLFRKLSVQVQTLQEKMNSLPNASELNKTIESLNYSIDKLKNKISYLENNVVYTVKEV